LAAAGVSRSKHQTVKGVFGGRSKAEVTRMIDDREEDVVELQAKSLIKRDVLDRRRAAKADPA
jgi:hypothetical protein